MSTDDLLDEATRLAGDYADYHHDYGMARVLNELIQRVQRAEDNVREYRWMWEQAVSEAGAQVARLVAESDGARGKLDKVREAIDEARRRDDGDEAALRETLAAILDGKTGD